MDTISNESKNGKGLDDVIDKDNSAAESNSTTPSRQISGIDSGSGIDIRQALDILASRTPYDHTEPPPAELKSMGQTIDMLAPTTAPPSESSHSQFASPKKNISNSAVTSITPVERRQKIRESIRDLPFVTLLKIVLTTQEDRVRTYRLYDEALGKVLLSNQLSDYPPACVAATATFAVLSDTVSAVRDELSIRSDKNKHASTAMSTLSSVIKSIGDLQASEREKLQLTAAFHLERIRANNLKQRNNFDDFKNKNENHGSGKAGLRELSLLNNGIDDLRSRIQSCRSDINDVMEDLRCALVEEIGEQEEQE